MPSAIGPERRCTRSRSSTRSTRAWSRSRNVSGSRAPASACSNTRRSEPRVIERPPRPATTVCTLSGAPANEAETLLATMPPSPTARLFSSTTTRRRRAERLAYRCRRPRPETGDADDADAVAGVAHLVDRVLDRAEHRPERNDHHVRVGGPVAAHQAAAGAAEHAPELVGPGGNQLQRLLLLGVREVAHLHERLGTDHGADRDRLGRVEHLARFVGRQVRVHLGLRRQVDALVGMRQDEAVHAHHDRQRQLLGQPESLDVQVERFLVVLGEQLQPAAVALAQCVGVVVPDVDRRADGAVGHGHDDGQAEARRVVDGLGHEQQALARSRRVGARARGRGADRHRHCRELGLDVDELAGRQLARRRRAARATRRCASAARSGTRRSPRDGRVRRPRRPPRTLQPASACGSLLVHCASARTRRPRWRRRRSLPPPSAGTSRRSPRPPTPARPGRSARRSRPAATAFGSGRPTCRSAISVAGTVHRRVASKPLHELAESQVVEGPCRVDQDVAVPGAVRRRRRPGAAASGPG